MVISGRKWATLIGYFISQFINAMQLGIYFTNLQTYASFFNVSVQDFHALFYSRVAVQLISSFLIIKMVEWRMDLSIYIATLLPTIGYWIQYLSFNSFYLTLICNLAQVFSQAILLPLSPYISERWFSVEQRPIVIGVGFYSNLIGYAFGGVISLLYVGSQKQKINSMLLYFSILSTIVFLLTIFMVRNQSKTLSLSYENVRMQHFFLIWKNKSIFLNLIIVSSFIGAAWSFQNACTISQLQSFNSLKNFQSLGNFCTSFSLDTKWIYCWSDCHLRCTTSTIKIRKHSHIRQRLQDSNSDRSYQLFHFWFILPILKIIICGGIGSLSFVGLIYMSLIESLYPVSPLLLSIFISFGASLHSIMFIGFYFFGKMNPFFGLLSVTLIPWVYFVVVHHTNLKRYAFCADKTQTKYQLLRIENQYVKAK